MKKKLKMFIPKEIATALSRRHNGREDITRTEILEVVAKMNILFSAWESAQKKLDYCLDTWWDKMEIEKYFMKSRWYYAHRKLKKLRAEVKEIHKAMFYLMVYTDGNYESFSFDAMDAQSIHNDFTTKYLKRLNDLPTAQRQ